MDTRSSTNGSVVSLIGWCRVLTRLAGAGDVASVAVVGSCVVQRPGLDPGQYNQGPTAQQPISTLGNSDSFGGFLSIVAITAPGAALLTFTRARWAVAAVLVAVGVLVGGFMLTTNIRNGVLGVGGGLAATAVLASWST